MNYRKITLYLVLYAFTIGIIVSSIVLTPYPLDTPLLRIVRVIIIGFASVLLTKYTVYMVTAPFCGIAESRIKVIAPKYRPLVSVMIPAWNEEIGVCNTVKTLLGSTYKHMEIIVVNDGSTDNSDMLMRQFIAKYEREMWDVPDRIRIVYHYQQNGGKGSALNKAIALSHGEILMSIDADCIVHDKAVESFVKAFRDPRVMAAVGNVKIGNKSTIVGAVQYLEYLLGFYFKKSDSLMNTIYIIGGAAGAFRREVFKRIGGYSCKNITEDIELSVRIQAQGWKTVYVPDALIITEGASTIRGLMKQRLRWKRGRFQTFWEHRYLFFSLDPRHNKILCWLILPLALFSELQLGLEPLFLLVLYAFSFASGDFSAFISGVAVVSLMFIIQALDDREHQSLSFLLLSPIGWLLFYLCTFVEVYALVMSIWMMIRKKEVKWQKWARKGLT